MRLTEDNYVDIAEKAIKKLSEEKNKNGRPIPLVTTSKIRNLLAMTADIYNEVVNSKEETLSSELIGRINYMKIRFIYEAGREPKVKSLVKEVEAGSNIFCLVIIWRHWLHIVSFMAEKMNKGEKRCLRKLR